MLTTSALLDAVKQAQNITSEYRLSRTIGVSDQALYNWRHGRTPDDERAAKLAEMAGLDVGYVLASLAAERCKDEGLKAAWTAAAKRLEGAAAALFLAILANLGFTLFDSGSTANAANCQQVGSNFAQDAVTRVHAAIYTLWQSYGRLFARWNTARLPHLYGALQVA